MIFIITSSLHQTAFQIQNSFLIKNYNENSKIIKYEIDIIQFQTLEYKYIEVCVGDSLKTILKIHNSIFKSVPEIWRSLKGLSSIHK